MQFLAYGALNYVDGRESELFARFVRADGEEFDMPLSESQLEYLLAQISPEDASATSKPAETPPPAPRRPSARLPAVPEGATIRIADTDDDDDDEPGGGL